MFIQRAEYLRLLLWAGRDNGQMIRNPILDLLGELGDVTHMGGEWMGNREQISPN